MTSTRSGESALERIGELFDTHHQRLYRLARRLSGSAEEARDLVQETYLRAAAKAAALPAGGAGEEAWLVRVLVNLSRDQRRRRRVRQREGARLAVMPRHAPSHEAAALAKQSIQAALAALPARRRAFVVLHALEGLTVREVASLLGVAQVTVRWHLARAYRQMASRLEPAERAAAAEEKKI